MAKETDVRLDVLRKLAAKGVSLTPDAIAAALDGPELGRVDADGRLRVTEEMIAPGSQFLRENRAAFNRALAEGRVDIVE
jgi:hypothetical protein